MKEPFFHESEEDKKNDLNILTLVGIGLCALGAIWLSKRLFGDGSDGKLPRFIFTIVGIVAGIALRWKFPVWFFRIMWSLAALFAIYLIGNFLWTGRF